MIKSTILPGMTRRQIRYAHLEDLCGEIERQVAAHAVHTIAFVNPPEVIAEHEWAIVALRARKEPLKAEMDAIDALNHFEHVALIDAYQKRYGKRRR